MLSHLLFVDCLQPVPQAELFVPSLPFLAGGDKSKTKVTVVVPKGCKETPRVKVGHGTGQQMSMFIAGEWQVLVHTPYHRPSCACGKLDVLWTFMLFTAAAATPELFCPHRPDELPSLILPIWVLIKAKNVQPNWMAPNVDGESPRPCTAWFPHIIARQCVRTSGRLSHSRLWSSLMSSHGFLRTFALPSCHRAASACVRRTFELLTAVVPHVVPPATAHVRDPAPDHPICLGLVLSRTVPAWNARVRDPAHQIHVHRQGFQH